MMGVNGGGWEQESVGGGKVLTYGGKVGWGSQGLPDWFQKPERMFG